MMLLSGVARFCLGMVFLELPTVFETSQPLSKDGTDITVRAGQDRQVSL
jgi:hypothetical protein